MFETFGERFIYCGISDGQAAGRHIPGDDGSCGDYGTGAMVTPFKMVALAPMKHPSPMEMGCPCSGCPRVDPHLAPLRG